MSREPIVCRRECERQALRAKLAAAEKEIERLRSELAEARAANEEMQEDLEQIYVDTALVSPRETAEMMIGHIRKTARKYIEGVGKPRAAHDAAGKEE